MRRADIPYVLLEPQVQKTQVIRRGEATKVGGAGALSGDITGGVSCHGARRYLSAADAAGAIRIFTRIRWPVEHIIVTQEKPRRLS